MIMLLLSILLVFWMWHGSPFAWKVYYWYCSNTITSTQLVLSYYFLQIPVLKSQFLISRSGSGFLKSGIFKWVLKIGICRKLWPYLFVIKNGLDAIILSQMKLLARHFIIWNTLKTVLRPFIVIGCFLKTDSEFWQNMCSVTAVLLYGRSSDLSIYLSSHVDLFLETKKMHIDWGRVTNHVDRIVGNFDPLHLCGHFHYIGSCF